MDKAACFQVAMLPDFEIGSVEVSGDCGHWWGAVWQAAELQKLLYLLKKIANFLHEFRSGDFPSLKLPQLPLDHSCMNIQAMLTSLHIVQLLLHLKVIMMCNNM